ncbi:hypothetical protein [Halalkalibacterium ligniniphilum]|uniref:hypothetical protein n=1 Tax=Halalkalibacterium ligniniphilum TaxID=1134413 RepID=UPI00034BEE2C|nr:hypothetical protein [Halalkalibacterium ligniniphilum]
MSIDEIIELLEEGDHTIHLAYDDKVKNDVVLYGAVEKKGASNGLDRHEFAFRAREEKEELLKRVSEILVRT